MGYILYTLYGHEGATTAVNFSPDGDYLCSGGADSVVMVWLSNLESSASVPIPPVGTSAPPRSRPRSPHQDQQEAGERAAARDHRQSHLAQQVPDHSAPVRHCRQDRVCFDATRTRVERPEHAGRVVDERKEQHPQLPSRVQPKREVQDNVEGKEESGAGQISGRLDKVVGQLNIITKTLTLLEQRMRVTEEQVTQLIDRANAGNNPFQGDPQMAPASGVVPRTEPQPEAQASFKATKDREPLPNPMFGSLREDPAASLGRPPPAESNI
jgi:hypothetical protein